MVNDLTSSNSFYGCFAWNIGTPRVFTLLADMKGVPIALTQFCLCSNLSKISVVYK